MSPPFASCADPACGVPAKGLLDTQRMQHLLNDDRSELSFLPLTEAAGTAPADARTSQSFGALRNLPCADGAIVRVGQAGRIEFRRRVRFQRVGGQSAWIEAASILLFSRRHRVFRHSGRAQRDPEPRSERRSVGPWVPGSAPAEPPRNDDAACACGLERGPSGPQTRNHVDDARLKARAPASRRPRPCTATWRKLAP
jgi:hypothetical protein